MATELLMVKELDRLAAADPISAETLASIRAGETVKITMTRARNPAFHRKLMALIGLVYKSQSKYATQKQVLTFFKRAAGLGETVEMRGQEVFIPGSISFAKMDETEFQEFYDQAVNILITELLPRTRSEDLKRRVEEIIAGSAI